MFFSGDVFLPKIPGDPQIERSLLELTGLGITKIGPAELLAALVRNGEPDLLKILRSALDSSLTPAEWSRRLWNLAQPSSAVATHLSRESFAAPALQAMQEFEAVAELTRATGTRMAPAVFAHLILANAQASGEHNLAGLNVPHALRAIEEQIVRTLGVEFGRRLAIELERHFAASPPRKADSGSNDLLERLRAIVPVDDLSRLALDAVVPADLPFQNEPLYERLFDKICRVLHRGQAHHAVLSGERGVGMRSVVTELARRSARGEISFLRSRRFLMVDARYLPLDETRPRLVALFEVLARQQGVVLCIDGFANLVRGMPGASNRQIMLSLLARSRVQLLGLASPRDCDELIGDDLDFAEFVERIAVDEPDLDVAHKLLRHFSHGLSANYRVAIEPEAVRQSVVLTANYILNDQLPAKALKLLHGICEDVRYERDCGIASRSAITVDDVIAAVAHTSQIPEETLRGVADRMDYEKAIGDVVFGQGHAVREVADELGLIKAGMTDPSKPASVMLFLGQTGTGKTELAKALSRFYSTSKRLRIYTLGNCVEAHSVSTIIGVPPGYVGNDQGGRLINDLNADPYCVFLLDEADKAHPDVLQPFLNLFDEGWICDQRGVKAFANKAIFILTTNVGQRMIAEMAEQGKSPAEIAERMKETLAQIRHTKAERPVFTPEFLARLKRVIVFNPLSADALKEITRKQLDELRMAWSDKRGKVLELPAALTDRIAAHAHQLNEKSRGKEGGRIVRKLIADWIESPLQKHLSAHASEYRQSELISIEISPTEAVPPELVVHLRSATPTHEVFDRGQE